MVGALDSDNLSKEIGSQVVNKKDVKNGNASWVKETKASSKESLKTAKLEKKSAVKSEKTDAKPKAHADKYSKAA